MERPLVCSSAVIATSACSLTPLMEMLILLGSDCEFTKLKVNVSACPKASLHKSLKLQTDKRTTNTNMSKILNSIILRFIDTPINLNNIVQIGNIFCSFWISSCAKYMTQYL